MGIKNDNASGQSEQSSVRTEEAASQTRTTQTAGFSGASNESPKKESLFAFNKSSGLFGGMISETTKNAQVRETFENLVELFKNLNNTKDFEAAVKLIDNENFKRLRFSVIVIALASLHKNVVGYYTLVFQSSAELEKVYDTTNNIPAEIFRTAADAIDVDMLKIIKDELQKEYPQRQLINCESCVVPVSFNPSDKNAIHRLASTAGVAIGTEIMPIVLGEAYQPLNLRRDIENTNLKIDIKINHDEPKLDAVGLPIRNDVTITLTSHSRTDTKAAGLNNGDSVTNIVKVTGYLDLIYAPEQQVNGQFNQYMLPQQNLQTGVNVLFAPHFIITSVDSEIGFTPEIISLAIYTVLSMDSQMNWIQAINTAKSVRNNELALHDFGAVNIEAQIQRDPNAPTALFSGKIDTGSPMFTLRELGDLVMRTTRKKLVISIDVPVAGASSHYLSFLSEAGNGNPNAMRAFMNALDNLTGGSFQQVFANSGPVFSNAGQIVHMGYYRAASGEHGVKDIRDIDRLAIMNYFDKQPEEFQHWDETFITTQVPLNHRLFFRQKRINQITGDTAVYTGKAQRVTFSGKFLDALAISAQQAGMSVQISTPLNSADFNNTRHLPTFVDGALGYGNNGNLFSIQQYGNNQTFGTGVNNVRWSS